MPYQSKYGVARIVRVPMVKRGVVDHAVGADWTPAAGDVTISKDGGAAANVTNLPTAIVMGNSALWAFSLTTAEMSAAQVSVLIADATTKAIEDNGFDIETYGHASAQHLFDLSLAQFVPYIKKNTALAKFQFLMTDSTTHAPATGKTVTVTRSIDNGAYVAGTLSGVTEIGSGMYSVDFASGDMNGNVIVLRATAASSDDTFERLITVT